MTTTRKTWKDFEKAGLFWFVNRLLHVFGWVVVFVEDDQTGEIQEVYPARTNMLGFELEVDEAGQKKFVEALRRSFDGGF
jgi:hypothetical protein